MTLTIKRKIQIAILVICAAISIIQASISISQLQNETTKAISASINESRKSTSDFISGWLKTRQQILLANEPLIRQTADVEREMLVTLHAGGFMSVYAGLDSGEVIYGNQEEVWPDDYDPRSRNWYQQAQGSHQTIITEPYVDFDGSTVVTLAKAFNGSLRGVIAADLTVDHIAEHVEQLQFPNQGFAFLLDENNKVLAYHDTSKLQQTANQIDPSLTDNMIGQLRQNQNLASISWGRSGENKLVQLTPIAGTGWTLGIVVDKALAYASVDQQIQSMLVAIFVLFVLIFTLATLAINRMLVPLYKLTEAVEALSQGNGDLTHRFEVKQLDEIGQLSKHMNEFLQTLQTMMTEITSDASMLITQVKTSSSLANQASKGVSAQHQDVHQIATAIHEMSATANEVANHAEMTANASQESAASCQHGKDIIIQSNTSIAALSEQLLATSEVVNQLEHNATEINLILSTIQSIAEQTNLLALNAAIEAARAGEQGRGFAVVADEVRVLSRRTQDSTEEIRAMILTLQNNSRLAVSNMQSSTEIAVQSVQYSEDAQQSLSLITRSISEISDMAMQIASAAEEQRAVSEDISKNTQAINDVSDALAGQTQEVSNNADQMLTISEHLSQRVGQFKI
ncbi:methyl-accepting chemotaxis protein [Shewanella eurypsychrophilus]|uniref:Methyl-accepting chemotaxis protein n=1 Tax=Shewanella eurypsychrophilus TaxID=2593656 RepID=A0ABX6VAN2_9GAMM|nr:MULTISPECIES: methyl-accepting chemotaxis protein [Shewanella]QFU24383.1 HAMP domain-containing protein [Shewanella sp. YLB-09]QPG59583.1 methyl-accepting chemotaxis protein [Shewanella eurypsychrophilus]